MNIKELDPLEYVKHAIKDVRVIWLGRKAKVTGLKDEEIGSVSIVPAEELVEIFKILDIRTRQWKIETIDDWRVFADSAFVIHATHANETKTWKDSVARKQNLWQYVKHSNCCVRDPPYAFEQNIITTVFDDVYSRRLIVDGNTRAAVITREIDKRILSSIYPSIEIWEARGRNINALFPCDVHQLRDIV